MDRGLDGLRCLGEAAAVVFDACAVLAFSVASCVLDVVRLFWAAVRLLSALFVGWPKPLYTDPTLFKTLVLQRWFVLRLAVFRGQ